MKSCPIGMDYGAEIRAQVLTRKWKDILEQHPIRKEDTLQYLTESKGGDHDHVYTHKPAMLCSISYASRVHNDGMPEASPSPTAVLSGFAVRSSDSLGNKHNYVDHHTFVSRHDSEVHHDSFRALRGLCGCAHAATSLVPGEYPSSPSLRYLQSQLTCSLSDETVVQPGTQDGSYVLGLDAWNFDKGHLTNYCAGVEAQRDRDQGAVVQGRSSSGHPSPSGSGGPTETSSGHRGRGGVAEGLERGPATDGEEGVITGTPFPFWFWGSP